MRKKTTEKGSENWLVLLFGGVTFTLIPVLFSTESDEPFQIMRTGVLSVLLLIFTLFFVFFKKEKIFLPKGQLTIYFCGLFVLFGGWQILASALSDRPVGSYEPIMKYFLFGGFFFLFLQLILSKKSVADLLKLWVVLLGLHAAVGLGQFVFDWFGFIPGGVKPFGFMGHRNLWGSFLSAGVFLTIPVAIQSRGYWRILATTVGFISVSSIVLSQSRSAWLGFLAGLSVLLFYFFFVRNRSETDRSKTVIGIGGVIVVVAIALSFLLVNDSVKNVLTERFATIANFEIAGDESEEATGSIIFRIKTWTQSFHIVKENPITGIGAGNWKIEIPKYGSASYLESNGQIMRSKPHNEFVGIACEHGLVGLLFFCGLILIVGLAIAKIIKSELPDSGKQITIASAAVLAALTGDMFFSFPLDRAEHLLLLFFATAVVFYFYEKANFSKGLFLMKNKNVLAGILVLIFATSAFFSFKNYQFEKYFKACRSNFFLGKYDLAVENGLEAKSPFFKTVRDGDPVELFLGMAYQMTGKGEQALQEFEKGLVIHPNNARIFNAIGSYQTSIKNYSKAIEYLKRGLELKPEYITLKKNLALSYFGNQQYEDFIYICESMYIEDDQRLKALYNKGFKLLYKQRFEKGNYDEFERKSDN